MGLGDWYNKQKVSVQVAFVGGIIAMVGGVVTGAVTGSFGVIVAEIAKPAAQANPAPLASAAGSSTAAGPSDSMAPGASSSLTRSGAPSSLSRPTLLPGSCAPKIAAVGSFESIGIQTVVIDGSCFGIGGITSAADTTDFRISDLTRGWAACFTDGHGMDYVTCDISSWTDDHITFSGYTGYYGQMGFVVTPGDEIEIQVWNPQSRRGPASCQVVSGSDSLTHCSGS